MGVIPKQSIEFRDFGGGITDDFVDCEDSQYEKAKNLLLDDQKKLFSRPGSILFDLSNPQPGSGSDRTSFLYNYYNDTNLFNISGQRVFYYNSGWTELLGPTGNRAFPFANGYTNYTASEWKRHIYITNNALDLPAVVHPNSTSTGFIFRTAGLPELTTNKNYNEVPLLAAAITLANNIQAQMLTHFNYTVGRYHTGSHLAAINAINVPAATDLASLLVLVAALQAAHTLHVTNDAITGSPIYHPSVISAQLEQYYLYTYALSSTVNPTTLVDACSVLNDIKMKWNEHDSISNSEFDKSATTGSHVYAANPLNGNQFLVTASYIDTTALTTGAAIVKNSTYLITTAVLLNGILRFHVLDSAKHNNTGSVTLASSTALPNPTTTRDLIDYVNEIIRVYAVHQDDRISFDSSIVTTTHVSTPSTAYRLAGYGTTPFPISPLQGYYPCFLKDDATLSEIATTLTDLQKKFALHFNDNTVHLSAANPVYQANTLTVAGFIYALHYSYIYKIDGTQFEVDGPVYRIELDDAEIPSEQAQTITNIPVLTNSAYTNYDTSNIKIKIFRTQANLKTLYQVGQISNGVTSFTDSTTDDLLTTGATIYTNGGIVESVPPPIAKYVHTIADTAYYANILDAGENLPQTIRQSVSGSPESVPGSFTIDLLEPCVGISSFRQVPIAFSGSNVYRLEGLFDEQGRGSIKAVAISDKGGCIAPKTIVQTTEGVYFAGVDGFYITNGYTVTNVTKELKQTYLSLFTTDIQKARAQASYDRQQQRIWFSVAAKQRDENNMYYVMDLNWGVLGDKAFTTASNDSYFAPSASCFFRGNLIRGDKRGYVFKHDYSFTNDPRIDITTSATNWGQVPIQWDHISRAVDYGSIFMRKYATDFSIKARNVGNVSVQVNSIDDLGARTQSFPAMRYRANCIWGDPTQLWGASGTIWNPAGELLDKRKFPANSLRFTQKQIQVKAGFVVIQNSDTYGTGTVVNAAKTVTIAGPTLLFQADLIDQYIYFDLDNYTTAYQITAVSTDRLTLTLASAPASGTYKWIVQGYPKNERLSLISYQMTAGLTGPTIPHQANELGTNA